MKLGISPSVPILGLDAARRVVQRAEEAGFDTVAFGEAAYDPFAACAVLADATEQIGVMTAVAGAWRSPALTVLGTTTVVEASGGRFTLGIGAGAPTVAQRLHGMGDAVVRIDRMREYVEVVRAMLESGSIRHRGRYFTVEGTLVASPSGSLSIHLAAGRPHMARLAGEVADGVLLSRVHTPTYLRQVLLPEVAAAERDLIRSILVRCLPGGDDGGILLRAVQGDATYVRDVRAATGETLDDVVAGSTLSGSPDECRRRLARYEGLVDQVLLTAPSGLSAGETEAVLLRIVDTFGSHQEAA